ncbi:hypothetical protein N7510_008952 [Penicillium lagena]|uniref:uncharacterized protein n=1 Tax=Penicillium lagena TaxID=94218 RepID=UPI002541D784|nr:uncharacterized protein N7510_008952 [Penicillium lagena]KAJ5606171.1 hypothetical protein N7510_008952 [Penicillium lagena]
MADPTSSLFAVDPSEYSSVTFSQSASMADHAAPADAANYGDSNTGPRSKRIACVVCRRRKLRCDGKRPSCGTCSRLGHECAYDEARKKSGPKRGYVKQLEARLAQVETLLKGQDPDTTQRALPVPQPHDNAFTAPLNEDSFISLPDISGLAGEMDGSMPTSNAASTSQPEPLPTQDVIDELDYIYFEKVHPILPIIHRPRYYAALNLAPHMRPPICLRYMMWCHAASVSDKYHFLHVHFYNRARKYADMDEMKGFGENVVSVRHCQTWILIGTYEFRMIYFPRAWLSVGKAARLALMMGLNRLDGESLDVKQTILPPRDWTDREERRRTFWMAFCTDRYASIGTGWPMLIDEQDIMTNLPASEESFVKSKPQRTLRLADILAGEGVTTLSPFGCVVVLASLFGKNFLHIHRPSPQDNDHDLNGEFWKRHRSHDNILLHIALSLPDHLRLPSGMEDVNVIFANMSIHTSTICLHQAAIFKAEKNKMPNQIITESKRRCLVAANQISSTMKMISHMDLTNLNPFMSFCLYISARVFVQYLKSRPDDSTVQSSLQFVVGALNAMKSKNPLTESFLVQLDVDLEGTGIRAVNPRFAESAKHAAQIMQSFCSDSAGPFPGTFVPDQPTQPDFQQEGSHPTTSQHPAHNGMSTSLPSRHKDSMSLHPEERAHEVRRVFPRVTQPGPDFATGMILDMDVDLSPDFGSSDKNNPPSDHPTPSTMNSSSNTSYSMTGTESNSPGKKQQKLNSNYASQGPTTTSSDTSNSVHISPTGTESSSQVPNNLNPLAGQMYPGTTEGSMGSSGVASAFSMPSGWNMPPNPDADGDSNLDFGTVLTEAQWANILNGTGPDHSSGWENWRST